jgi:Glycosyl transferase family 11
MKILVPLKGGLGNQLFQYSYAKNLQQKYSAEVYFDTLSYFISDYRYRRKFMLKDLILSEEILTIPHSFLLFLYQKIGRRIDFEQEGFARLVEHESLFQPETLSANLRNLIVDGYWQSPRYFAENNDVICRDIVNRALLPYFKTELCQELNSQESVGFGIRLYSESSDPDFHSYKGIRKTVRHWQLALDKMIARVPNSKFYIFTVDNFDLISHLNFYGRPFYFVNQETIADGFPRLALFASCRHQLFNNSTFYWWGAYLRRFCVPSNDQQVEISDNFINQDAYPAEWSKF